MKRKLLSMCAALLVVSPGLAWAGVVTNIAPSSSVIDASGSADNWRTPKQAIDGRINEGSADPATYWLGPAGDQSGYFILDLHRSYQIQSVKLYNTHNRGNNDSGTAQFSVTASDQLADNYVGLDRYYPFNGTLQDASGKAVDAQELDFFGDVAEAVYADEVPATVTNGTQSLSLSGGGEMVIVPDPAGFQQPTAYSYALWVKLPGDTIIPTSLILRTSAVGAEGGTYSHQLRVSPEGKFESYAWVGSAATVTSTTVVQPGVWYHVACTAENGGKMHLYINGTEEGTPANVGVLWTGGALTEIGSRYGAYYSAPQLICDLGIWYSVLDATQIHSLSQGHSPASTGAAKGYVLVNPKPIAFGTLTDVAGQDPITGVSYTPTVPPTARYVRFDALSRFGNNSVGLNELQIMAEAEVPTLTTTPAVELTWPQNLFSVTPQTATAVASAAWTPFTNAITWTGDQFKAYQTATAPKEFFRLPGPVGGGIITTNVAAGGTIVSASGAVTDVARVIDGNVNESPDAPGSYWLAPDGTAASAGFVLDLRQKYPLKSVALYNTHNGAANDRGTAAFELYAADGLGTSNIASSVKRYFPLDNDLSDHSTTAQDAMLLDGPNGSFITPTFLPDRPAALATGTSLLFDTPGMRLEIPDADVATQPTAYTLAFWVKFQDLSSARNILTRTTIPGAEVNEFSHQVRVTGTGLFQAYTWDDQERTITGTTVAQPGVWYHVAVTAANHGQMHLYVNGVEEGTPTAIDTLWAGGSRWVVGPSTGNANKGLYLPLLGQVDDLAIWYGAISASAAHNLFTGSANPASLDGFITTPTLLNPQLVASGTLTDVSGQDTITPDVFTFTTPVTTRYLQFRTLSGLYNDNVGLNEIQAIAEVSAPPLGITSAVLLSWPQNAFNVELQSSLDGTLWTPVAPAPVLTGDAFRVFQPAGRQYRLQPR